MVWCGVVWYGLLSKGWKKTSKKRQILQTVKTPRKKRKHGKGGVGEGQGWSWGEVEVGVGAVKTKGGRGGGLEEEGGEGGLRLGSIVAPLESPKHPPGGVLTKPFPSHPAKPVLSPTPKEHKTKKNATNRNNGGANNRAQRRPEASRPPSLPSPPHPPTLVPRKKKEGAREKDKRRRHHTPYDVRMKTNQCAVGFL